MSCNVISGATGSSVPTTIIYRGNKTFNCRQYNSGELTLWFTADYDCLMKIYIESINSNSSGNNGSHTLYLNDEDTALGRIEVSNSYNRIMSYVSSLDCGLSEFTNNGGFIIMMNEGDKLYVKTTTYYSGGQTSSITVALLEIH